MPTAWSPSSPNRVVHADNLEILPALPDGAFTLIYLDPPFNTGRKQNRRTTTSVRVAAVTGSVPDPASADAPLTGVAVSSPRAGGLAAAGTITGFKGQLYERIKGDLLGYDDQFEDYWAFLEPRLIEAWRLLAEDGPLYLHLDYREAHYAKVL
ncbi:DNA methyltransferase, partial [Mucilaginibacter sp. 5C4]|nr:DNA methyltransferase [Mucilaginibacter sp. 5C4]